MKGEIEFGIRYIKRKLLGKRTPYKLTLMPTRLCNSKCKTCGIWRENKSKKVRESENLTIDEYENIAKNIGNELLWLNITGGEPFINEHIGDIILTFVKWCPNLCLINIPTNGILTYRIANVLRKVLSAKKLTIHITLSLDGLREQQDDIRGIYGVFRQNLQTYEKLLTLKQEFPTLRIGFQTTLSEYNAKNIEEVMDFAQYISDVYIVTFAQVSDFYNNKSLNIDQKKDLMLLSLKKIYKRYNVKSISHVIPKIFLLLAVQFLETNISPIKRCSAGKATVSLDCKGNIQPCLFNGLNLDNVRNNKYNPFILKDKYMKSVNLMQTDFCRQCWINCEAIPTMFDNLIETLMQVIKKKFTMR